MAWKMVMVPSWVPDETPPGIWGPNDPRPTPPIYLPPAGGPPYPDQGLPPFPAHPIAPGGPGSPVYPDQGLPPFPSHPIVLPPETGHPDFPPHPDQGLPGDQPHPDHGLPGDQPHPDHGLPQPPPGIWGPPGPWPTPPIHLPPGGGGVPEPPLGIWGPTDPRPTPPIANVPGGGGPPSSPIFDPDQIPTHPDLPDMDSGAWIRAYDRVRTTYWAFVAGAVGAEPNEPEQGLPGNWVVVVFDRTPAWAWIPDPIAPPEPPVVDNTLPEPEE